MSFDESWEKQIYSQNKHINRYPYGELVSIFFNSLKFLPQERCGEKKEMKILELGCGSGNNLWFLSELGFDVYGVDASSSACAIAKKECEKRGTYPNILEASFDKLPFEENCFDIIIDRESTYCGTKESIKNSWSEANRVLKSKGVVISFMFCDDSPDLLKIQNKEIQATCLEPNTYTDVQKGTFKDTGIVHFTSYDELLDIFSFCDIQFINKNTSLRVYNNSNNQFNYCEWIVVGVKK
ncbi:class I SAM-dependent methyltransferase [bacterium]|nr:class I SAM-dependent methyltransferase [bacterium]MBU1994472.1 class I SAM-dependent methyltransferase [bacterium]